MRFEPPIDRMDLIEAVSQSYGFSIERLTFVPVGYAAACFVVECAGGERYFLKYWPTMPGGRTSPVRPAVVLPLAHALHTRGLLSHVPSPLPTRDGALWATVGGDPFAVFPFLVGHEPPPWPVWPTALRDEVARTIARLHLATRALADVLPPRETFAIPFEADLLGALPAIERIEPHARPGLRGLRDLVLPRRGEILAQLARLRDLQQVVRRLSGPRVLCHTDIGPGNLLVDEREAVWVLDWDDATVAPPEHDLQAALADYTVDGTGKHFARFLEVYAQAEGAHPLHVEHFAFYLLRRYLGDMTVRLVRILQENTVDEEDQDTLGGIEMWGFVQWAALDETLLAVSAALAR